MYECKKHDIQLFFLPPHTSHVTQPLDLSCFSAVKTRYRKDIQELASFDNSAKVKKDRFISAYNKARNEGLTSRTIRSGFLASGMVPFNPEKALNSRFVLQPEKTTVTPKKASRKRQIDQVSPATPCKYLESTQIATRFGDRSARKLFRRAGKRVESLTIQIVLKDAQIRQLETTLTPFINKQKRKKVTVAPNEQIVNIETIKAAFEATKALHRLAEEKQEVYEQNHPQSEFEKASHVALELGYDNMGSEFYLE
jgi:hypothetical protein